MHVLVICTGNVCRSPMGERLLRLAVANAGRADIEVTSAGTSALVGDDMDPKAARALASYGADVTGFAARQLTPQLAIGADLILTMTMAHRSAVLRLAPRTMNRCFTLGEAARLAADPHTKSIAGLGFSRAYSVAEADEDIDDPHRGTQEDVMRAATIIATRINSICPLLLGAG